jgi:hypothetical protein
MLVLNKCRVVKYLVTVSFFCLAMKANAQNVGIGTTTPTGPLSFASNTGNKIVLWGNGSQPHIGIGVGSSDLQFYTQNDFTGIAFGYGRSDAFTERVRITNSGIDAMNVRGRISLFNPTPENASSGAGVWLYKPDNSGQLGFMGTQNSQNIGFYGGPAAWGFTYDAINSRVGIGNNTPAVRLDIGGTNSWDLINGEGDMRIGTPSYRIKLGIALGGGGVGAAGIMQAGGIGALSLGAGAKYLLQMVGPGGYVDFPNNTGGIRINGDAGTAGQVLTSTGNASAPQWKTLSPGGTGIITMQGGAQVSLNNNNVLDAGSAILFTMPANAKLLVWARTETFISCTIGPCHSAWEAIVKVDVTNVARFSIQGTSFPGEMNDHKSAGPVILDVSPGPHTLTSTVQNRFGNPIVAFYPIFMIIPN